MKTLKLGLAAFALLFVSAASNAGEKNKVEMTEEAVVNTYVNAISTGNTKALNKILDDNMQYNMQRGDNVKTINKATFIRSMEGTIPVTPANINTTVLQSDDSSEKVKIIFTYDGYSRTDVVTLYHSASWNITDVTTSF